MPAIFDMYRHFRRTGSSAFRAARRAIYVYHNGF
jgi:hypothetical protein